MLTPLLTPSRRLSLFVSANTSHFVAAAGALCWEGHHVPSPSTIGVAMLVSRETTFTFGPADYAPLLTARFNVALDLVGEGAPRLAPRPRPDRHVPNQDDHDRPLPPIPLTVRS